MRSRVLMLALSLAGCDQLFGLDEVGPPPEGDCVMGGVATGRDHSCAIDGVGRAWCWGLNDSAQVDDSGERNVLLPRQLPLDEPAAEITAGRSFTCVRLTSGRVLCRGANEVGQLGTGPGGVAPSAGLTEVNLGDAATAIGAGANFGCALLARDGAVTCWGSNQRGSLGRVDANLVAGLPESIAGTAGTLKLAVGHRHSCLIDAASKVRCWGRGELGQTGGSGDFATPTVVGGLGSAIEVAAGGRTSCAVEDNHTVRCWGRGEDGQLGNGTFTASTTSATMTPVITDGTAVQLGSLGGCARRADGTVVCWGMSDPGNGVVEVAPSWRASTLSSVDTLAHRFFHSCATRGDQVQCWGADSEGQLGRGTRGFTVEPTPVPGITNPTLITAGDEKACAVSGSTLRCWGSNDFAELANPNLRRSYTPVEIALDLGSAPLGIVSGVSRTCAWNLSEMRCWGLNRHGETGSANNTPSRHTSAPLVVTGVTSISSASAGSFHTCAATTAGLRCWGANARGQLGNNSTTQSPIPVAPIGVTNVSEVAAGSGHTCAIDSAGLKCWGDNTNGQLGYGDTTNRLQPGGAVGLPAAPSKVGAGAMHTCALQGDGTVHCWGRNDRGQLGVGSRDPQLSPVVVPLPAPATAITLAANSTCATLRVQSTLRVYCWGAATRSELPVEDVADVLSPLEIPALQGALTVSLSRSGGCAIRPNNGGVVCWGHPAMLGNDTNPLSTPQPVVLDCR